MCAYCATYALPIITLTEQIQCHGREDANDNAMRKCNANDNVVGPVQCSGISAMRMIMQGDQCNADDNVGG